MSALGLDPAPGDPEAATGLGRALREVADGLAAQHARLAGLAEPEGWRGEAARAFAATLAVLLPGLERAAAACAEAADALVAWAAVLRERQAEARRLAAAADAAAEELAHAQARHRAALDTQTAFGAVLLTPEQLAAAQLRAEGAALAADAASAELLRLQAQGRQLRDAHEDDAARTARRLAPVADAAPSRAWPLRRAVGAVADEARDHAEVLAELSDVVGEVATVAGVATAAVGVVAASPLVLTAGAVVGAGSLVALGGHALARAAGADVEAETLALDALGVVTAGAGQVAGRLVLAVAAGGAAFPRAVQAGRAADGTGLVGSGYAAGAAADEPDQDDRALGHLVPDDRLELGALVGGPVVLGAVSAVRRGREKDRGRVCG